MENLPDIPGEHVLLYKLSIDSIADFREIRKHLFFKEGVEDVILHKGLENTYQMIVLTNGTISDAQVRSTVTKLGYQATPEKLPLR